MKFRLIEGFGRLALRENTIGRFDKKLSVSQIRNERRSLGTRDEAPVFRARFLIIRRGNENSLDLDAGFGEFYRSFRAFASSLQNKIRTFEGELLPVVRWLDEF